MAKLQPVDSSVLSAIRFHEDRNILEVRFRSGRIYLYSGVPQSVYEELLAAPSLGGYFNRVIRPRYAAMRVEDRR